MTPCDAPIAPALAISLNLSPIHGIIRPTCHASPDYVTFHRFRALTRACSLCTFILRSSLFVLQRVLGDSSPFSNVVPAYSLYQRASTSRRSPTDRRAPYKASRLITARFPRPIQPLPSLLRHTISEPSVTIHRSSPCIPILPLFSFRVSITNSFSCPCSTHFSGLAHHVLLPSPIRVPSCMSTITLCAQQ